MDYSYSESFRNSPDPNNIINPYMQNFPGNSANIPIYNPQTSNYTTRPLLYQQSDPRFKGNSSSSTPADSLDQKTDDELWIETYLSKIGKINLSLHSNVEIISKKPAPIVTKKKTLKIHVAKSLLHRCLKLLTELEKLEDYLKENVATISSSEWKEKTVEIGQQKDEFTALLSQFDDTTILEQLKKSLAKRKKKRISFKRKKIAKKEEQAEILKNRQLIHKNIDQWLENMKDNVQKARREEILKKDADCILAEVTKKKSDARKQLSLLTALVKLRNVREKAALQRGEKISLEDSNAFKLNAERLRNMWENALKIYSKEEVGLRATLEENAAHEEVNAADLEKQKNIAEWRSILFGPRIVPNETYWGLTCAEKDLGTFIAIRKSWDTFLVSNNNQNGTRIPIGWILPETADTKWSQYIKKD